MTDHPEQHLDMVREDFEAWAKSVGKTGRDLEWRSDPYAPHKSHYTWRTEQQMWNTWQAATQRSAERIAELEAQVKALSLDAGRQISEGEFAPDAKLMELADKIDHEQNWRHSGIFQRDHLTKDQKDRMLAGVMLRRYADLMAPESWRLFPPKSVVSHSYRAATLEAVIKMAERHGIDAAMKEKP